MNRELSSRLVALGQGRARQRRSPPYRGEQEHVRITLRLPLSLYKSVSHWAIITDSPVNAIITEILHRELMEE